MKRRQFTQAIAASAALSAFPAYVKAQPRTLRVGKPRKRHADASESAVAQGRPDAAWFGETDSQLAARVAYTSSRRFFAVNTSPRPSSTASRTVWPGSRCGSCAR